MLYDLSLAIGTEYAHPAAHGRHILRVSPLALPGRQEIEHLATEIDPEPDSRAAFTTFFGGPATNFAIRHPHQRLEVSLKARLHVTRPAWATELSLPLEKLHAALASVISVDPASPHHFTAPSPRLPKAGDAIAAYAREEAGADRTIFDVADALMRRINRDFVYDGKATSVDTPAASSFQLRRGVCQDFTHIMITALRSLGIPAGYVSGYLRTLPPKGKPKLVGADAMHAWVRAWCGPEAGWIEFDPTNRMLATEDHIVAGYGRDYSDIAPLAGTVKAHGKQKGFQRVDISIVE